MYFPLGWPKFYNGKLQVGIKDKLKVVRFNRSRSLFVTISDAYLYLWKTNPRVILAVWHRNEKCVHEQGINQDIFWNPDSSMLAIVTEGGYMILLDIFEVEKEYVYYLEPVNPRYSVHQLHHNGLLKIELSHRLTVTLKGKITSVSARIEELFITTTEGWIHRLSWSGAINSELSVHICDLLFGVDFETPAIGSAFGKDEKIFISKIECSPVLGGFAIVLSDGRGGFLSSSTTEAKPKEIVGVFAKDLNNAVSLAVNIKYQIIVYGQTNGKATAYAFDDMSGGLVVSHTYSLPKKDYPGEGLHYGAIKLLSWTPDGCALATLWSNSGIAVWSIFGALLMCVQSPDCGGGDLFRQNALPLLCMDWGFEGYELLLIPNIDGNAEKEDITAGDILSMKFVKSALTVNPCMSNRQHLFLQGDDCVYLNTGDVMLQTTQGAMLDGNGNGMNSPSMHFSNKHWQTFQVPNHYIKANWPIRYTAIDDASKYIAVAGIYGYTYFSLSRRKWKLFGNETQENNVTCRGGLTWWRNVLVVGCFYFQDEVDEVRLHHTNANLDVSLALRIKVSAPIFLVNIYNDILLIYCSDCSITFYKLAMVDVSTHVSGISATKISETTLIEYLIHPITVTSLGLAGLKNEQTEVDESTEGREAHSLIANIAGKVVMLQKDKPAAERTGKKVQFMPPVVLASCVENIWYMVNPLSSKQHLSESLWLACGARGMQAWLPLFPTCRPLGFLSKRIMLHFSLQLYPLAVLFEDAVIIGIGNEDIDDCLSPSPLFGARMPFPYFNLERTTQVYLPQILKQLLRRNLGVHALDIARSCTNLPYFSHVLELMLHEVLEKEATAKANPIPDPLLPRVVAFIQEFPQFLETVCHCARKTEVALWQHLFSVVGDPIDLFQSCHSTGKLETAASYLLIIQSLETPSVSRQHATLLLETALEKHKWELARDIVRFLRAIGNGDNESPPRTPVYKSCHKSSYHQNLSSSLSSANIDDTSTTPVMIPLQRQSSRTSMPQNTVLSRSASASTSKERTSSMKEKRPANLKLNTRGESLDCPSTKPINTETSEHVITENILNQYAQKLLRGVQVHVLATFAAHLEFNLEEWLAKERFRSALINDFVEAITAVHEQFDWPFPIVTTSVDDEQDMKQSTDLQQESKDDSSMINLASLEIATPTTPLESEFSYPGISGDDIEARLVAIKEDIDVAMSDVSSIVTCVETPSERLADIPPTMNDVESVLLEKQSRGPQQSLDKLEKSRTPVRADELYPTIQQAKYVWYPSDNINPRRYLLKIFVDARCLDWVIVLSIILFDSVSLSDIVSKVDSFKDVTRERLTVMIGNLNELNLWLETKCPVYQPILNTIITNCETLLETAPNNHVTTSSASNSTVPNLDDRERSDTLVAATNTHETSKPEPFSEPPVAQKIDQPVLQETPPEEPTECTVS